MLSNHSLKTSVFELERPAARLLLLSKDPSTLRCLSNIGQANSWVLDTAQSGLEALERMQSGMSADLVVLDLATDDPDSLRTLRWLRRVCPRVPILLLSESDDHQRMVEALRLGARDFLIKPCQEAQLERVVKGQLLIADEYSFDTSGSEIEKITDSLMFVAASPAMKKLRAQGELLAQVNVPVLIIGEKGTGKKTTAQLIHELSLRSGSRYLTLNCSAMANEHLEQELFGASNETADGAPSHRPGKLESGNHGTLLLEEVSEMPAALQTQLLTALQGHIGSRRGADKVALDVRILATNTAAIESHDPSGNNNGDLLRLLCPFTIHVPALRQRREDIPLLLGHFMKKMARHYGLLPRTISVHAMEACLRYSWPGNITELENFVKGYLMLGDDSLLMVGDGSAGSRSLSVDIDQAVVRFVDAPTHNFPATPDVHGLTASSSAASLKSIVKNVKEEAEKSAIAGALDRTRWNRKAAARLLQISYRALLYKIEQHQMRPPQA